ncbi:MFS transporter [Gryllotalpicola reticulitermitis]|uniref:MFS transporter n=1 Tax=Gryllotalpicola reticulitermitis TaxID=1184153 RepID=A0ABV8Q0Q0_9MICO
MSIAAGQLTDREQGAVIRKLALRLIPILAFAYFINSLDKTNISLAALQMNKALGLTDAAFGLASGLLFVGYAVFEIPSNMILYKVGARRWIARIMISWGLVAAATSLVWGPGSLYVLRILLGIAEAGFYPGVLLYFTLWVPRRWRGQLFAWFVFGGAISGVIGSPLTGLLLSVQNYFGAGSWRAMFIIEGLPAIIIGILCLFLLQDHPKDAKWLTTSERSWLVDTLDRERTETEALNLTGHANRSIWRSLIVGPVLFMALIYFCAKFGQYALNFFLPLMIQQFEHNAGHNLSTFHISLLTALPALIALFPAIWWAAHSDKTKERVWHAAIPQFLACVGIVASVMFHNPVLIMIALIIATLGTGAQSAPFFQIPPSFLTGMAAATSFAVINSIGNLGGFVAPTAFGILHDWTGNYNIASLIMGAVALAGAIMTLLIPRLLRPKGGSAERTTMPTEAAANLQ